MGYVDFILNLAGLLLWLNWRSIRFDPLARRTPATLMGTLRPAAPKKLRRWHLLLFLVILLLVRAMVYCWLVPLWVGKLDLGVVMLHFRSDSIEIMLVYSFFSFAFWLGAFYVGLLLLSLLGGPEPIHALVKVPLGRIDRWSRGVRLGLPLMIMAVVWWFSSWLFGWMQILPANSMAARFEQSVVIGFNVYLIWKLPAVTVLVLHLLNSYIYFGRHPLWKYVDATARIILMPLRCVPLQVGKLDLAPVLGIVLIFLFAEGAGSVLAWLYAKLPF